MEARRKEFVAPANRKKRIDAPQYDTHPLEAGFEVFASGLPPTHQHRRTIKYTYENDPKYSCKRKVATPKKHDKPSNVKLVPIADQPSPRQTGMRHVPAYSDGKTREVFDIIQKKKRVVLSRTGRRAAESSSAEWDTHNLYGRTRKFEGRKTGTWSHGLLPGDRNFLPDTDAAGNRIDYFVKPHGPIVRRAIRTDTVPVKPDPEILQTTTLRRGAAERYRKEVRLAQAQPAAGARSLKSSASMGSLGGSARHSMRSSHSMASLPSMRSESTYASSVRDAPKRHAAGTPSTRLSTGSSRPFTGASFASSARSQLQSGAMTPSTWASTGRSAAPRPDPRDEMISSLRSQLATLQRSSGPIG